MCAAQVSLWSNSMAKNWTSFSYGKICPSYVNFWRKCVIFKNLLKITAEVLAVEILKFHVSAQGFKMFSAFCAAEIAALGFLAVFQNAPSSAN